MKKYIPFVIAFASFMEMLDVTIITTAIPQMAVSLGSDPIHLKIALTSYLLSIAIFIPISGWFCDRFGTKRVFVTALAVFTMGSLFCSLAMNINTLIISRVIQGIGGALMMPVGRLILLKSFPRDELVKVTNYINIPALIGPALGPVLGGLIVSYVSWRWIFIVNIPFGIAAIIFASKALTNYVGDKVERLDFVGFIVFGLGLAGMAFTFDAIGENSLEQGLMSRVLLVSLALLTIYFIRSRYVKEPFLDLTVFKIRTFRITILGNFFSRCGVEGMRFLLPLFFQLSLTKSPMYSGLLLLPYAMGMLIIKLFIRDGLRWLGFRSLLIINTFLLGMSILIFGFMDEQTPLLLLVVVIFIHGVLTSIQFSCVNVLNYVDLTARNVSKGTSIAGAVQQLSMSFGIGIAAIILGYFMEGNNHLPNIPLYVFHQTFSVIGLVTIVTTFIFMRLHKEDGAEVSKHKERIKTALPILTTAMSSEK